MGERTPKWQIMQCHWLVTSRDVIFGVRSELIDMVDYDLNNVTVTLIQYTPLNINSSIFMSR
jgi:hypothetical protein